MKLLDAFKAAFDSLVRTYSPMLVGAIVGALAVILGIPVPEEVKEFVVLGVAFLFGALWYGILRIIEIIRGKASKLLGLGIVKTEPTYSKRGADDAGAMTLSHVVLFGAVMALLVVFLLISAIILRLQMGA